jgi:hypothetical protein
MCFISLLGYRLYMAHSVGRIIRPYHAHTASYPAPLFHFHGTDFFRPLWNPDTAQARDFSLRV